MCAHPPGGRRRAGEHPPHDRARGAREYLDSSVEGADALWSDYIEHWLLNQVTPWTTR